MEIAKGYFKGRRKRLRLENFPKILKEMGCGTFREEMGHGIELSEGGWLRQTSQREGMYDILAMMIMLCCLEL